MADADEIERVALRAARAAGRIHMKRMSRTSVTRKTNAVDIVTEADHEAEAVVIETLQRAFPAHAILAEESGGDTHPREPRWRKGPPPGPTHPPHRHPPVSLSIPSRRGGRGEDTAEVSC